MDTKNPSDFSIVIQGKIFGSPYENHEKQLTLNCIESIRTFLPGAEIILSTWEGSDVSHLPFDKVIFNHDPGAIAYSIYQPQFLNNNNRQIVSTYNGLKAAGRKYAIKMRGDCKLLNSDFLNYLIDYPRSPKYKFFEQRIVIPTVYSRNPRRIAQLMHPSDIFQVGLLEDLLQLWSIPLQPEPETSRAIPIEKEILNNNLDSRYFRMKFGAEQYIWYAFAKSRGLDLEIKYYSNIPASKILPSEMSVINNYIIVEPEKLGVLLPERMTRNKDSNLYTHQEWQELAKKYAAGVSIFFKIGLIAQVYSNNIKSILTRAVNKLFRKGPGEFFTILKRKLTS